MMVLAVTLHNIPEGMAVGVMYAGFLAGNTQITAASALVLSLGIAIQNFPEGAIISMPLRAEGESKSRAFLGGVLSGVVEPIGAVLTLLGYTDEDFAGNQAANRMAKAAYLELDENIGKVSGDTLTWIDCVHLFYNLMRTNKKEFEGQEETTSTVYASVLDFSLTSDGEINPLEALESKLKGPYAVKDRSLGTILPFSASSASYYLDGEGATRDEVEDGAIVIYYNTTTKAVYGYSEDGNGGRGAYEGELEAVYYRSSDVMIPTSIVVSGREFALESSDMQFAFSVYGNMEIGDDIIIVWESSGSSSGEDADDTDGTVIDYID